MLPASTTTSRSVGHPLTVVGIARAAGVSRSWLYTQPDLIEAIGSARSQPGRSASARQQQASEASLQQRLEAAHRRNQQLREQNTDLTTRLEAAYGEIRRLRITAGPSPT